MSKAKIMASSFVLQCRPILSNLSTRLLHLSTIKLIDQSNHENENIHGLTDRTETRSSYADVNLSHKSATELVWPMTRHQEKFASRVYRALDSVITQDSTLNDELVRNVGFSIKDIRVSPDHSKAFILWDSYTGRHHLASNVLKKLTPRIKAAMSRALATRHVPRLEFRLDRISEQDQELERALLKIEKELRNSDT